MDLLRSYGLEPRSRVLLDGPPGSGKTTLAEAIACETMLPFYVVRYEGVVSSFLGETASRLDAIFDFARTRRCVLFLDEFDSIAKERSDLHETGEIKRVVSTLLLQIDRLPAHVVVVCSTNHSELLDRAAWRRFQLRLELRAPTRTEAADFLERLRHRLGGDLGLAPRTLADKLPGASYAELEQIAADIRRRLVLELPGGDAAKIARSRIEQWRTQAHP
ncbi:MAG: ATP-binding protein [Acidimicrobiaceae bacterium]|nr:ATP-binding protein [Acidimicrobiaceae bacterium]MCY4295055.1 ATP-binding protein [Acidimicrobiaceae bacterium]